MMNNVGRTSTVILLLLTTLYLFSLPIFIFGALITAAWSGPLGIQGIMVFALIVSGVGSIWGAWIMQRKKRYSLAIFIGIIPLLLFLILALMNHLGL